MAKRLVGLSLALSSVLAGCVTPPPSPPPLPCPPEAPSIVANKAPKGFSSTLWAEYIESMSGRDGGQLRQEAQRLTGKAPLVAEDRLKLAWLLDQEGASDADLTRSQDLLAGLEGVFYAPALNEYVRLKRRAVTQTLQIRKEHQQVEELRAKIERLKSLEQNLSETAKPLQPMKK